MALKAIGAKFEHYRVVEFDKYAIQAYNNVHGTDFPVIDIRDVSGSDLGIDDTDKYNYLLIYSFPCTDISVAGRMQGMAEGSETRSSLLWEVRRLLDEVENLPQILVMENVPAIHSAVNMPHFQKWLDYLDSKGYSNYWQDLNAKNYGVAQNRDRCFCVSVLGEYNFKFPKEIPLLRVMKDYLEDEVEEKYFINSQKAEELIQNLIDNGTLPTDDEASKQASKQAKLSLSSTRTDHSMECTLSKNTDKRITCDLSVNNTEETSISNTIMARQDRGISNHKKIGDGESSSTVHMNGKRIEKECNIAKTLMARDYKGFGTGFDVQNGVVIHESSE